jgi:hypothetical protein
MLVCRFVEVKRWNVKIAMLAVYKSLASITMEALLPTTSKMDIK